MADIPDPKRLREPASASVPERPKTPTLPNVPDPKPYQGVETDFMTDVPAPVRLPEAPGATFGAIAGVQGRDGTPPGERGGPERKGGQVTKTAPSGETAEDFTLREGQTVAQMFWDWSNPMFAGVNAGESSAQLAAQADAAYVKANRKIINDLQQVEPGSATERWLLNKREEYQKRRDAIKARALSSAEQASTIDWGQLPQRVKFLQDRGWLDDAATEIGIPESELAHFLGLPPETTLDVDAVFDDPGFAAQAGAEMRHTLSQVMPDFHGTPMESAIYTFSVTGNPDDLVRGITDQKESWRADRENGLLTADQFNSATASIDEWWARNYGNLQMQALIAAGAGG